MLEEFEDVMGRHCAFTNPALDTGDTLMVLASVFGTITAQLEGWTSDDFVKTVLLAVVLFCVQPLVDCFCSLTKRSNHQNLVWLC